MPGAPALGELGVGNDLQAQIDKMLKVVKDYDDGSAKPLPVMELIATVSNATPGDDGLYSSPIGDDVVQPDPRRDPDDRCLGGRGGTGEDLHLDSAPRHLQGGLQDVHVHAAGITGTGLRQW